MSYQDLFSKEDIADNLLYGEVMIAINELYKKHGYPPVFYEGENRSTTTGSFELPYYLKFSFDNLGDWSGFCIDSVANIADGYLNDCYWGFYKSYLYVSREYGEFEEEAMKLLDKYSDSNRPFEILCESAEFLDIDIDQSEDEDEDEDYGDDE